MIFQGIFLLPSVFSVPQQAIARFEATRGMGERFNAI